MNIFCWFILIINLIAWNTLISNDFQIYSFQRWFLTIMKFDFTWNDKIFVFVLYKQTLINEYICLKLIF
jgi:hypothetical protein